MDLVPLFTQVKPAVVAIVVRAGDGPLDQHVIGTGFNVDARGVIVTCRHVIGNLDQQLVAEFVLREKGRNLSRGDFPISFAVAHDTDDVAIIRLMKTPVPLPFLTLSGGARVSEGTAIGVCGYPLGLALQSNVRGASSTFQVGIVGAIMPYPGAPAYSPLTFYRLDIPVNYGNSGGPMFLQEDGAVVGVISERPNTMEPVFENRAGRTELTAAVSSALTHAVPIDRSLHLIERVKRLTDEEIVETARSKKFPSWWEGVTTQPLTFLP